MLMNWGESNDVGKQDVIRYVWELGTMKLGTK